MFDVKDWWDGYKYLLWSGRYTLWICSNATENVFLECTPAYHGKYYYNIKSRTRYTEYMMYLQQYKTLFTFKMSRQKVQDWFFLAAKYIKMSEDNIEICRNIK